jgi:hypothetical protein
MKKIALLILISCLMFSARGSHLLGGNIAFAYTGITNKYVIQLTVYRDCAGITIPMTDTVCVQSTNCNYNDYVALTEVGSYQVGSCFNIVTPGGTTCVGGTSFGVERHDYEGILILPFACDDWELVFSDNLGGISPIPAETFLIKTRFDNLHFPTNSSPSFGVNPCFVACVQTPLCYSFSGWDMDADTLFYFESILDTTTNGACPQIYGPCLNPYNNGSYITSFSQMDSVTGLFCFNVPSIMVGIVPYKVTERSGEFTKSTVYAYHTIMMTNTNNCSTGINETETKLNFSLSNNVSPDFIHLSFTKPLSTATINIYNALGKKVRSQKIIDKDKVDLSIVDLSGGVYLVEVILGNAKQTARFVKL